MKVFVVYDLDDTILGKFQRYDDAEKCFLEYHPHFDKKSIDVFIYEEVILLKCQDSYYDGLISYDSWKLGKLQSSYCNAIKISNRRFRDAIVHEMIINTFKISKNVIYT